MEKGTQERKITLKQEELEHYTQFAEKLASGLTSDEAAYLLEKPLPPLLNPASMFYRSVHSILDASHEENEKATLENKIVSDFFRSELQRKSSSVTFNNMPLEMVDKFSEYLDIKTLVRFTQVSPTINTLFKAVLTAGELLSHVMDANPDKVKQSLARIPEEQRHLILKRVPGIEKCGRAWKAVSPLEFAAWIGDMEIVKLLVAALPPDLRPKAKAQLEGVRINGLEHGKHMAPFHSFIEKCRNYDRDFDQFKGWDAREEYCIKSIGGSEKFLSLFGLQWFCDPVPFFPVPSFNRPPSRALLFEGKSLLSGKSLETFLSNLGVDFFIYKFAGGGRGYWARGDTPERGMRAGLRRPGGRVIPLESLCLVSSGGLDNVISQLDHEITATKTNSNS